jgi:hypothetical protein
MRSWQSAIPGRIQSLVSRRRQLYLLTSSATREEESGGGRRTLLISRKLCRVLWYPKTGTASAAKRMEMLKLQIERVSPFEQTGSHMDVGANSVTVWIWDQGAVEQAAARLGIKVSTLTVLPETALQPALVDGLRLIQTTEGYEAQRWVGGSLTASRYWPEPPGEREWTLFQRGASVTPQQMRALPPMAEPHQAWLAKPWTRSTGGVSIKLTGLNPRLFAVGVGALLLIALGYVGTELGHIGIDLYLMKSRVAQQTKAIEPQLEARNAALDNRSAILAMRKLDPYPSQSWMMARVSEIMPHNDAHVVEWDFERGQLQLKVTAGLPLDTRFFVHSLEGVVGFSNVTAERFGTNGVLVRLTVEPK